MAALNQTKNKTREQIMRELDERLRLNRGSFSNIASEVGSNIAFRTNQDRRVVQTPQEQNPYFSTPMPQAPATPIIPELPEYQLDELPENPTPQEMLQAIFNEAWEPQLPTTDQLEILYQETGRVYPVASNEDGTVTYNDGSIQQLDDAPPMPIATMNDGNILWSDGFIRERPAEGLSSYLAGVSGLSQFIFGQDQTVTQPYGNPSPTYASGMHQGVDFRTRDLTQRNLYAPVPMRVVQTISADSGSPYGNSVLLELPSGEMIRLSHLSNMGQFQIGDILNPGDLIGVPGNTGRSTGEHLDVEYYNKEGQIDNPNNFRANANQYNIGNQIVGVESGQQTFSQETQPEQNYSTEPQPAQSEQAPTVPETIKNVAQKVSAAAQPLSPERRVLGAMTEKAGEAIKAPELYASEVVSGELSPGMAARKNIEERRPTGDRFDLGISEALTGDIEGGLNIFKNTASRIGNRISRIPGQLGDEIVKKVSADDGTGEKEETLGENIGYIGRAIGEYTGKQADRFGSAIKQAGEGIKSAAQPAIGAIQNIFQKKALSDVSPKRAIGEDAPGGDRSFSSSMVNEKTFSEPNDIRDQFFKTGMDKQYSEYLDQTPADGALKVDLFKKDFFEGDGGQDRIKNVFGGTSMEKEAQSKYDDWKRAEDERIARENEPKPTLEDYLSRGKTAAQYYAETGQQSTIDDINRKASFGGVGDFNAFLRNATVTNPDMVVDRNTGTTYLRSKEDVENIRSGGISSGAGQNFTPAYANYTSISGNASYAPQPVIQNQTYTPINANYTSASGRASYAPPPQKKKDDNIFTRATSAIKNIFGR